MNKQCLVLVCIIGCQLCAGIGMFAFWYWCRTPRPTLPTDFGMELPVENPERKWDWYKDNLVDARKEYLEDLAAHQKQAVKNTELRKAVIGYETDEFGNVNAIIGEVEIDLDY